MAFARPVNDKTPNITSQYSGNHSGVDYAYPIGTKIYASEDGKVAIAKGYEQRQWIANSGNDPYRIPGKIRGLRTEDYGNFIKIIHSEGYSTLNAHLRYDGLYVSMGDSVKKGQLIAEIGSTGNSTGNHDHFELRKNDIAINPAPYMDYEFAGYFDNPVQPQPPMNNDQRAYFFDLYWKAIYGQDVPTDKVTLEQVQKRIIEAKSEKLRGGKWDQIAKMAGFSGDTNDIPVDLLFKKIQEKDTCLIEKEQLKMKIKNYIDTV